MNSTAAAYWMTWVLPAVQLPRTCWQAWAYTPAKPGLQHPVCSPPRPASQPCRCCRASICKESSTQGMINAALSRLCITAGHSLSLGQTDLPRLTWLVLIRHTFTYISNHGLELRIMLAILRRDIDCPESVGVWWALLGLAWPVQLRRQQLVLYTNSHMC